MHLPGEDTITAIATALAIGQGGIAVIRISGPDAISASKRVVTIKGKKEWRTHTIMYGHVKDNKTDLLIDEILVLVMRSPRSFTGEDVVEIHCHGGVVAIQQILEIILENPKVRRALPGEFSQRAVLNGRINLTQAEAISDLISARSKHAAAIATSGLDGGIQRQIDSLRDRIVEQLSEIEARIDFEEDLPPLNNNKVISEIKNIEKALTKLIEESKQNIYYRNGIKIAIIGAPNAGKSSLLNLLSKNDKAIVTSIPGTTRDILENNIIIDGVPICILDTAGIRQTKDAIEREGILRTKKAIKYADVVILIFDLKIGWTINEDKMLSLIPENTARIIIGNKIDIIQKTDSLEKVKHDILMSSLTGQGEEDLNKYLLKICGINRNINIQASLNERQIDLAIEANAALSKINEMVSQEMPFDFWTIYLREAIKLLGEITGQDITEVLLDRIFSRFCIGK
mgnify:CR=1 FL=1|tara:strand:+ start:2764 stop:4134 length:1371 start_codon:yes stop_codon:yes gene_type:complete